MVVCCSTYIHTYIRVLGVGHVHTHVRYAYIEMNFNHVRKHIRHVERQPVKSKVISSEKYDALYTIVQPRGSSSMSYMFKPLNYIT